MFLVRPILMGPTVLMHMQACLCPIASSSGLWQSSTVADGDRRCMPVFCIENFGSVAMISVAAGLQYLRTVTSATSSSLLIMHRLFAVLLQQLDSAAGLLCQQC